MNSKWKTIIRCGGFIIGLIMIIALCDYLFGQEGYIRFIINTVDHSEQNYDTIIIGSSHARSAIDPQKIDNELGTNSINLAIPGETIKDSYYVLKEACSHNRVKKVILDVDYQYWINPQKEGYFAEPFIYNQLSWTSPFKWEYLLDNLSNLDIRNAFTQRNVYLCTLDGAISNIKFKNSDTYKNNDINNLNVPDANGAYIGKGFFYRKTPGTPPKGLGTVQGWYECASRGVSTYVEGEFAKIKKYCDQNNIELIAVTSPITPEAMEIVGSADIHKVLQTQIFDKYGVDFYDFNMARMDVLPRENKDFGDLEGHMGGKLAEEYSSVLGEFLKDRDNGTLDTNKYMYSSFDEVYQKVITERNN